MLLLGLTGLLGVSASLAKAPSAPRDSPAALGSTSRVAASRLVPDVITWSPTRYTLAECFGAGGDCVPWDIFYRALEACSKLKQEMDLGSLRGMRGFTIDPDVARRYRPGYSMRFHYQRGSCHIIISKNGRIRHGPHYHPRR